MSKDWRIILRFAVVGLVISAAFAAYQGVIDSKASTLSVSAGFIVLCPVSLLFTPLFVWFFEAAEAGTPGFYLIWTLIGLANAALYAVIGAAYVGVRKKPEGDAAK
jgi:hypothetical protein